jgi:hypothetical protein
MECNGPYVYLVSYNFLFTLIFLHGLLLICLHSRCYEFVGKKIKRSEFALFFLVFFNSSMKIYHHNKRKIAMFFSSICNLYSKEILKWVFLFVMV